LLVWLAQLFKRFCPGTSIGSDVTLTATACTNAKDPDTAGVTIYTVAFSVTSDPIDVPGQNLLKNCASQTSNYFLASDSTALNTAFGSIAQGIGQLRLTK
jgi:hypothetical protein